MGCILSTVPLWGTFLVPSDVGKNPVDIRARRYFGFDRRFFRGSGQRAAAPKRTLFDVIGVYVVDEDDKGRRRYPKGSTTWLDDSRARRVLCS
ncbi:hypothetical protein AXG93_1390s1020 [Marchantia polymorpha subsp. ruderalis]|uniref:Uncharacterized protein n=1 Tax=Marchantia polymorpha subsp. ruderalis TaxID=1480154 RepID=A0A176W7Z4_MARPO|nr:hypothetical protein AXG93_1390s1020 [Marchantia polymorpha subsp. ruderalis]